MKAKRAPTIRSKLVTLVLACVVPASLMAVVLIAHEYQRAREHLLFNLLTTARTMMSVVDRDIASIESSLVALATSSQLQAGNFRSFYAQAQTVLKIQNSGENTHIALLDAHGRQILNTRRPFREALPGYSAAVGFNTIRESGKPFVSNLFVSPITHRYLLTIGVPVPAAEATRHTLHAAIYPERFEKLLQQQRLPSDWVAAVFDSSGTIIARSAEMQRFVGRKGSPSVLQHMQAGEPLFISTTYDGTKVHTAVSHSNVSDWSLAIGIPTELINKELRTTMMWLVLATIALLSSSLGAAWLIGGRIAESIHGLTGPALALGSGEIVTVPPLNLREADEVGASLVRVSEMLHHAQHRANHDILTGLANRALFDEMLNQHLSLCERNRSVLSILYIDLDGFKAVNDRHGHEVGDKLLCNVASRLKAGSRHSDMVSRLGGDEFTIIMVGATMHDSAIVAGKLVDSLSLPYEIDDLVLHISASIGVASYPESGVTAEILLQRADVAMYRAKETGRRRVETANSSN